MLKIQYEIVDILKIFQGELHAENPTEDRIKDVLIDSRRLIEPRNCLFFALVTRKNDGHKYIDELYNKGVRNFVVTSLPDKKKYTGSNFIRVKNTLAALQALAAHHRRKFVIPVIAITGSNGKTVVKERLFQLLSYDQFVIRSPKSYNSQIGVPLSVLQINDKHNIAIIEAGISEPDEMDRLQKIIQPTIGLFTNIGEAHNENFITTIQKIGEKLKLFTKVKSLVYCTDYSAIQETIIRSGILDTVETFTWGKRTEAALTITEVIREESGTIINGRYDNQAVGIRIPFTDGASVENAIHCWVLMLLMGYEQEIIAGRIKKLQPVAMRLELKEGVNNCSIINDSYNSDINSLSIALDFLHQQKQHKQKTLIISDILQSGRNELDLYSDIARLLESKDVKKLIGIGPAISKHANKFKMEKYFYDSTREFLRKFSFASLSNESILLKGARVFEFEQISKALQQKAHETVLEINLNALVHNLDYYKSLLDKPTRVMAMVKAFSYGSGSFEIANVLQFHKVDYLAVAYADEGMELRKAGINLPVMVMNPDEESLDGIIFHALEPEIYNFRTLDMLEKAIEKNIIPPNKPIKVHIKLDTGMHRLGFMEKDLDLLIERLKANRMIYVQSIFSHLAASDLAEEDEFTRAQIRKFDEMSDRLVSHADHEVMRHILNSAGIFRFRDAQYDMVRLGIGLYGVSNNPEEKENLANVSTLRSSISQIKLIQAGETIGYNRSWKAEKEMRLAIVPIGYADGLKRSLSNGKGKLMINGKEVLIIGDICMDMCMVDVTDIQAEEGDDVIVFGDQMPIEKLAKEMNTIPYEVLTGISRRVKRVYFQE
ncbi:MAG: bifunctional UDP-N-acetylmuramoyl-tripeptide:D-alanyl-D-alanine ligase/alanine racemase [Bacteroidales bacterium]|nr:bifunctional UDP-N-acetylmuramoyl-tripeptide:D-alanyl-D-alanine ligase/alanine racemase [Bacteroidales bacterium]